MEAVKKPPIPFGPSLVTVILKQDPTVTVSGSKVMVWDFTGGIIRVNTIVIQRMPGRQLKQKHFINTVMGIGNYFGYKNLRIRIQGGAGFYKTRYKRL